MSTTIFRGTSRLGKDRQVEVTDDGEHITLSLWTDTDMFMGSITLDPATAAGLGRQLRTMARTIDHLLDGEHEESHA